MGIPDLEKTPTDILCLEEEIRKGFLGQGKTSGEGKQVTLLKAKDSYFTSYII